MYISKYDAQKLIEKLLTTGFVLDRKKTKITRNENGAATLVVVDSVQNNQSKTFFTAKVSPFKLK